MKIEEAVSRAIRDPLFARDLVDKAIAAYQGGEGNRDINELREMFADSREDLRGIAIPSSRILAAGRTTTTTITTVTTAGCLTTTTTTTTTDF